MKRALCCIYISVAFFFFSSRRRHTRCSRDWSSDVCSSDLWIGALVAWASSTSRTIWPRAESLPTRVARNVRLPVVVRLAPITSSPIFFATGSGSPGSSDSSTAEAPDRESGGEGKRVDLGGRRIIKKKKKKTQQR